MGSTDLTWRPRQDIMMSVSVTDLIRITGEPLFRIRTGDQVLRTGPILDPNLSPPELCRGGCPLQKLKILAAMSQGVCSTVCHMERKLNYGNHRMCSFF